MSKSVHLFKMRDVGACRRLGIQSMRGNHPMGAEKHYAGRWICQKPAKKCKGYFSIQGYGERIRCPLADRCLSSGDERGQLEYVWPMNSYQRLLIQSEVDWDRKHLERRSRALMAFDRETLNAYQRKYREENKETINERHRERYDPGIGKLLPGYVPRNAPKEEEPPCGGDCRNCPYQECRYEDWEGPRAEKRRRYAGSRAAYAERRRERMKNDPEYAERERAKGRAYTAKYRKRKKAILEKQRKEENG